MNSLTVADIKAIESAKAIIDSDTSHILIPDLAERVGLSESKLAKGYKELYGHTIYQYRLEVNMPKAKAMLLDGKLVKEVASILGYKSRKSFSHSFKKFFKVAPDSIRRVSRLPQNCMV